MHLTVPDVLIPLYLTATKANRPFVTADGARRRVRERFERPVPFGPPRRLEGVEVRRRLPDPLGWPVYDVVPASAAGRPSAPDGVVVYLHGGGWVHEIARQHWRLIARIARETSHRVLVPIHPLLPRGTARPVRDGVVELIHHDRYPIDALAACPDHDDPTPAPDHGDEGPGYRAAAAPRVGCRRGGPLPAARR